MRWENRPVPHLQDGLPQLSVASANRQLHPVDIHWQCQAMSLRCFMKSWFSTSPWMARHLGIMLQAKTKFLSWFSRDPCMHQENIVCQPGILKTSDPYRAPIWQACLAVDPPAPTPEANLITRMASKESTKHKCI